MSRYCLILVWCTLTSLVLSTPTQRNATTNCFPLISSNQQTNFPSGNLSCVAIPEDPVKQGNLKVSTYHWLQGLDTPLVYGEEAARHLQNVNDGIQRSLKTYADFVKNTSTTVNLVLVPAGSIMDWGITGRQSGTPSILHRFSVLVADWDEGYWPDDNRWARTAAHELYHCVLRSTNVDAASSSHSWSKWWVEGGASFFATTLFPEPLDPTYRMYSDSRHPDLNIQASWQRYDPTKSMYNQKYAASLFLLDMYTRPKGAQSLADIHSYLSKQTPARNEEAERRRVAADGYAPDHFKVFAQRFVDNVIKEGRSSDVKATVLPPYSKGYRAAKTVKLAPKSAPFIWTAYKLVSFGFVRLDLTLQAPDITNKMTYAFSTESQAAQTILYYRPKTGKEWTKLDAGATKKVYVGCGSGPQEYILLIVSTDEDAPSKPVVKVTPQSSEKCPGKSSRRDLGESQEF
ncbi:hypothetical protein H2200_009983 [Cladophialophora chaetospira]|uniref:Uncharacterized protein n=1 Tax=Cladophialophora chaetospira TaxID=386627 RepID=A0AA38X1Z0_9EURO|nr:hypothetical protein H2200_009983 [Cladophialophora chaetospira]